MDYEAVMESQEQLLHWSNRTWPVDGFPLSSNLADLQRHEEEHLKREAFTYTVMNPDSTRCEGCVYINPWKQEIGTRHVDATMDDVDIGDDEAVVTFWIRSGSLNRGLDSQLVAGLLDWFSREWAFSRIVFMTNDQLPRQMEILEVAGLKEIYRFGSPEGITTWLFYA